MNESDATNWIPIGRHAIRFEAPDLVFTRAEGTLSGPEGIDTWKLVNQWSKGVPDLYWIMDIAHLEHYSGAALRAAGTYGKEILPKIRGLVCVGGSYRQRTVISVAFKAGALLRMVADPPESAFLETVDEARIFIDQVRQRRAR